MHIGFHFDKLVAKVLGVGGKIAAKLSGTHINSRFAAPLTRLCSSILAQSTVSIDPIFQLAS